MEFQYLCVLRHLLRDKRRVYLDNNATTPVSRRVVRTMQHILKRNFGNPSSLYSIAQTARSIIEKSRQQVAGAINADPSEIIFTGSATESNNTVLQSLARHYLPVKNKIISSPIEHPSIIATLEFLRTQGIAVEYCPVDSNGRVLQNELERMIDEKTFLICCMCANNEIGTLQEVGAIVKIAHRHGAAVLSDCVQALGKVPIDLRAWGVDYATFSAHKLHGPKGVGALYVKQGSPLGPLHFGGHQENGLRAGTEGLHNIAGFGTACNDIKKLLGHADRIGGLKRHCTAQIKTIKPDCVINSSETDALFNTISVTLPGIRNADMLAMLDYHGIAVSAGSACSAQEEKPSPVLKAIGLSDKAASETIRISLGSATTLRDIRYLTETIRKFINSPSPIIKMISPEQLDEAALVNNGNYLLDVRSPSLRKKYPSLPHSHEAPFSTLERCLPLFPKNQQIIVVCQGGGLSVIAAFYLASKGFTNVANLTKGLDGWMGCHKELYRISAGQHVVSVSPQ